MCFYAFERENSTKSVSLLGHGFVGTIFRRIDKLLLFRELTKSIKAVEVACRLNLRISVVFLSPSSLLYIIYN